MKLRIITKFACFNNRTQVLSNVAVNPNNSEKPYDYIQRLFENRDSTVTKPSFELIANTQYLKFTDFETAYVGLFDIISPGILELSPIVTYRKKSDKLKVGYATRFKGSVQFFQYFEVYEQLDMQIWFYPNGIGNPAITNEPYKTEISTVISKVINDNARRIQTENMPSRCEFEFGIPDAYQGTRYENGEVLVLCRLITGDNEHIPIAHKDVGRYLCINALTYNTFLKVHLILLCQAVV